VGQKTHRQQQQQQQKEQKEQKEHQQNEKEQKKQHEQRDPLHRHEVEDRANAAAPATAAATPATATLAASLASPAVATHAAAQATKRLETSAPLGGVSLLQESAEFIPAPEEGRLETPPHNAGSGGLIRREVGRRHPAWDEPSVSNGLGPWTGPFSGLFSAGTTWSWGRGTSGGETASSAPGIDSMDDFYGTAAETLASQVPHTGDAVTGDLGSLSDQLEEAEKRREVSESSWETSAFRPPLGREWVAFAFGSAIVLVVMVMGFFVGTLAFKANSVKPLEVDAFVKGGSIALQKKQGNFRLANSEGKPGPSMPSLREWMESLPVTSAADVDKSMRFGFYDSPVSKPLPSCGPRLLRLQGVISATPTTNATLLTPIGGQECVMYSASATARTPDQQAEIVARSSASVDFVITMQAGESCEKKTHVEVSASDVLLFDMFWGKFSASRGVRDASPSLQDFLREHKVPGSSVAEDAQLDFQESALLVGTKVTFIGELRRGPTGTLSLLPIRGGAGGSLAFSARTRAASIESMPLPGAIGGDFLEDHRCDDDDSRDDDDADEADGGGGRRHAGEKKEASSQHYGVGERPHASLGVWNAIVVEASGHVIISDEPTLLANSLGVEGGEGLAADTGATPLFAAASTTAPPNSGNAAVASLRPLSSLNLAATAAASCATSSSSSAAGSCSCSCSSPLSEASARSAALSLGRAAGMDLGYLQAPLCAQQGKGIGMFGRFRQLFAATGRTP